MVSSDLHRNSAHILKNLFRNMNTNNVHYFGLPKHSYKTSLVFRKNANAYC